ncbi:hypothetical protein ASPACDRAFT_117377 [Aspergillus aculeatus ATCC 16872]|uniref:Required for respiratory growth protein 9, mitochondrial n=1 Tax=Aspergillus aculeatus (strain ATCC 16872 / CBS 172.66 / WB 5094) TaxID=690307 RepID=A0A1L9WXG3_ASPA1|nr:uncharacterized protein ASPACDRAFT_117377 [Aspergillus aculeatus ATCC 16872]OJK00854.1 hypothetical protein ASPACDRAFT_117377 [Aspergillus aculeatus ATCC 16872]
MWHSGAASARMHLSSLLHEAFQSDLARSTCRVYQRRSLFPITPLAYRKPGAQRSFSSTHQIQIHNSHSLLSSSDTFENSPDATNKIETVTPAKNERGDNSTDTVVQTSESSSETNRVPFTKRTDATGAGRERAKGFRSKPDSRGDRSKMKPSEGKPKTWRDAIKNTGPPKKKEHWQTQKAALKEKFKEGWNPPKKLSPDAIEGIRHLHQVAPDKFTTPVLAEQFKVSPEAIRRILKSKWRASDKEMEDRRKRWERRHDRIWAHMTELGLRPPTKDTEKIQDSQVLFYEAKGDEDKV